jgi:hypothetical protein
MFLKVNVQKNTIREFSRAYCSQDIAPLIIIIIIYSTIMTNEE